MIIEKAYAKINLALHVVGKRKDGYHDLEMIVSPLELADELRFEEAHGIQLTSNVDIQQNAVIKTARYIQAKYNVNHGVHITLDKHIPIGSGLGGESADIAATIRGLNKFWCLGLENKELEDIACALGSDTVFCLYNKTAYVSGRGEHLRFLEKPPINDIYLCVSDYPISTRDSFKKYRAKHPKISFKSLLNMYEKKDYETFFNYTYNDLLETAFLLDKTLKNTYVKLKKGYKNAYMTGSGSTVFLIENEEKNLNFKQIKSISQRKVIKTALFA